MMANAGAFGSDRNPSANAGPGAPAAGAGAGPPSASVPASCSLTCPPLVQQGTAAGLGGAGTGGLSMHRRGAAAAPGPAAATAGSGLRPLAQPPPPPAVGPVRAAATAAAAAAVGPPAGEREGPKTWKIYNMFDYFDELAKKVKRALRTVIYEPTSVTATSDLAFAVRRPDNEIVLMDVIYLAERADGAGAPPNFCAGGPRVDALGGPLVLKERLRSILRGDADPAASADLHEVLAACTGVDGGINAVQSLAISGQFARLQQQRQVRLQNADSPGHFFPSHLHPPSGPRASGSPPSPLFFETFDALFGSNKFGSKSILAGLASKKYQALYATSYNLKVCTF